jgi:hypothetical protein
VVAEPRARRPSEQTACMDMSCEEVSGWVKRHAAHNAAINPPLPTQSMKAATVHSCAQLTNPSNRCTTTFSRPGAGRFQQQQWLSNGSDIVGHPGGEDTHLPSHSSATVAAHKRCENDAACY